MAEKSKIFLSSLHLGAAEFEFVREAFATNWIAPLGPHVDAFEREFVGSLARGADAEARGQRTEVGGQRTEDGGRRSEEV